MEAIRTLVVFSVWNASSKILTYSLRVELYNKIFSSWETIKSAITSSLKEDKIKSDDIGFFYNDTNETILIKYQEFN